MASRTKTQQGNSAGNGPATATAVNESKPAASGEKFQAANAKDAFIGRVLSHYRLEERLGAGGMGLLYRAADLTLGRAVAVKLLARHLVSDGTAKARFIREARAASALDHPNIGTVHDIGEEQGELFIVMTLYEGETLKQRLEKGRLREGEALDVLRQVLLGLEAAHRAGIIHRDIKPANVLMTGSGTVKILDFGLAKLVSDSQGQMTQAGQTMGTVLYMSPEQLRGETVDARSDLWSVGVLAYELLAGVSPFQTDSSAATAMRILNNEPASLAAVPGVSDWLAERVSLLLRKNPPERPQTASEVLSQLEHGTGLRPTAAGTSKVEGVSNWFSELKRRRVFRALVGYGIAAFAVLQIIEPTMHGLHWPETVLSYVVVALAAGFPVVITLAWIFDVKGGHIERTAPAAGAAGPRGVRLALLLIGIGVLAAAPGVIYYFVLRGSGRSTSAGGSDSAWSTTSIAVLPFASLSTGEENAYFVQGFHDELLRQMGRIGDLRVISRTSVLQYKDGARSLREIAEALGVSSIVEGSVQRSGNRVRVEAKLIDARNDRQVWADHYDRDVTDIFGIQTAVAEEIANALHARLSAAQKAQIERRPTLSAEAYDLYLRALDYQNRPGFQPDNLGIAERLYRQAIQEDPAFALARARLAYVRMTTYWAVAGTAESVVEEAREEAEKALHLQTDLPEAHLAIGAYHYWGQRDYGRALQEFEIARSGGAVEAVQLIGHVTARQGKLDESIRNLQEALHLDPRSPNTALDTAIYLLFARRYEEADQMFDRALKLAPDLGAASVLKAVVHEAWKGETDLAKAVLRAMRGRLDPRGRVGPLVAVIFLLQHNPREAVPFLDSLEAESLTASVAVYPKAFLYAVVHEALGDAARARKEYEAALPLLEAEVKKNPRRALQRTTLARAYAGLGRKEDALREARRAVDILPMSKDTVDGSHIEVDRAIVEARVGETDAAIEHIRHLLSVPCVLSPALLRIDPRWAPLRGDARFRQLAELDRE